MQLVAPDRISHATLIKLRVPRKATPGRPLQVLVEGGCYLSRGKRGASESQRMIGERKDPRNAAATKIKTAEKVWRGDRRWHPSRTRPWLAQSSMAWLYQSQWKCESRCKRGVRGGCRRPRKIPPQNPSCAKGCKRKGLVTVLAPAKLLRFGELHSTALGIGLVGPLAAFCSSRVGGRRNMHRIKGVDAWAPNGLAAACRGSLGSTRFHLIPKPHSAAQPV